MVVRCKLLPLECISNEVLLYSPGKYVKLHVIEHDGVYEEKIVCVCVCVCVYNHFVEELTEHCKSTITKNFKYVLNFNKLNHIIRAR